MPKKSMRSRSRSRSRQGGMWPFDSTTQGSSSTSGSSTGSWSDWLTGKKPDQQQQYNLYGQQQTTYPPPVSTGYGYGGRKGKRRRSMRGGNYSANTSLTDLAASAESVSGVPTATASYVGGRTRRRRHRKSCKKSCRKH